jgi:hypothetical protein
MESTSPPSPEDPSDPYWKLRPGRPTPDDELCKCESIDAIVLCDKLGNNPLYCYECKGEVAPERIGFGAEIAEEIARWLFVYRGLHLLSLDSREYEQWALARLCDPQGTVHVSGRAVVSRLNDFVRAYYWWSAFNDPLSDELPLRECPVCSGKLLETVHRGRHKCDNCRIVVSRNEF